MNEGLEINMGPDDLRVMPVIVTTLKRAGDGSAGSPVRIITQIWNEQGTLLHEIDPFNAFEYRAKQMLDAHRKFFHANGLESEANTLEQCQEELMAKIYELLGSVATYMEKAKAS